VLFLARRYFHARNARKEETSPTPRTQNPSAFMAASMQGVISKTAAIKRRKLERLHRIERSAPLIPSASAKKSRAICLPGLLVVNVTGIISSANPAAEQVLGIRGLSFRRYSEALGEASDPPELVAECLTDGKIFSP